MKREVDEVQDLQDTINKLKVRSESSAKRQALRNIKPSSFYAPAAGYSALTIEDNDEDLSDSTFEPSTQESTESTEDIETPEEEELETTILGTVEACTPVFFNTTALYEGDSDGASDYHGSDDGEGPDESPPVQYFNKTEKWLQRAASMLSSPNPLDQRFYGLPSNLVYWTTFMYKYKREENRWVKKGPVILYFNQQTQIPRLMGNYLYGTKANCLDMQIFETLIHYLRCANNLMCFSTFRRNAVKKAEIVSEKVALELIFPNAPLDHSLPVFKCTPRIYSAQEEDATVFALKFISPQECERFRASLSEACTYTSEIEFQQRLATFNSPQPVHRFNHVVMQDCNYKTNPNFCMAMARNGLVFNPTNSHTGIIDTVKCTWCGALFGPFTDVVDVVAHHRHAHSIGEPKVSCPFLSQS